jgi:hypothetical protein
MHALDGFSCEAFGWRTVAAVPARRAPPDLHTTSSAVNTSNNGFVWGKRTHLACQVVDDRVTLCGGAFGGDILVSWDTTARHGPGESGVVGERECKEGEREGGHCGTITVIVLLGSVRSGRVFAPPTGPYEDH